MWKPRRFPQTNAVVFDSSPHGRRFLTENLYRMAISRITHVFEPARLAASIQELEYKFVFVDWGHNETLRDQLATVIHEWSPRREFKQLLVLTTPDARESNLKAGLALDCDAIILKPYSPRIFCSRVAWAFKRRQDALHKAGPAQN